MDLLGAGFRVFMSSLFFAPISIMFFHYGVIMSMCLLLTDGNHNWSFPPELEVNCVFYFSGLFRWAWSQQFGEAKVIKSFVLLML